MEMILYRGEEAFTILYDECDHEMISARKWTVSTDGYVKTCIKCKITPLHRFIMNPPDGLVVDHINHVKTDNRRENLRICTKGENGRNRLGMKRGEYVGISKPSKSKKFRASINNYGKSIYLGCFNTEEEAARAYDSAAAFYHKEFACLNFPDEIPREYIERPPSNRKISRLEDIPDSELNSVLLRKKQLKMKVYFGEIAKADRLLVNAKTPTHAWFKIPVETKHDKEYVRAIKSVISERNAMYRRLLRR